MARMSADSLVRMRALAHPVRLQLLSLLTGSPMCAAEAGRWLQMSQANVSYHLRMLERAGLVEVAEEVSIRGGRARGCLQVSNATPILGLAPKPFVGGGRFVRLGLAAREALQSEADDLVEDARAHVRVPLGACPFAEVAHVRTSTRSTPASR